MKAILAFTELEDDKPVEHIRLFDTEKAKKICDVTNSFKNKVQEIYITERGVLFLHNIHKNKLEVADQEQVKRWIGEHEPDKYIEIFGEVEEG